MSKLSETEVTHIEQALADVRKYMKTKAKPNIAHHHIRNLVASVNMLLADRKASDSIEEARS